MTHVEASKLSRVSSDINLTGRMSPNETVNKNKRNVEIDA